MKREEDWLDMIAEKVADLLDEEFSSTYEYEKSFIKEDVMDYINELKTRLEEKEDETLSKKYGHRAELPEEQWETIPPGMSLVDWYFSRNPDSDKKE